MGVSVSITVAVAVLVAIGSVGTGIALITDTIWTLPLMVTWNCFMPNLVAREINGRLNICW